MWYKKVNTYHKKGKTMITRLYVKFFIYSCFIIMYMPTICPETDHVEPSSVSNDTFAEDITRIQESVFFSSMNKSSRFHRKKTSKNAVWSDIVDRFHTFQENIELSEEPHIPNIIHHIWLGSKLPKQDQEYMQTWRDYHPAWLHFLWTDRASNSTLGDYFIDVTQVQDIIDHKDDYVGARIVIYVRPDDIYNKEAYLSGSNFAQTSNILRYEILYNFGGLYLDTDFICLRAFDVFHHGLTCYACLGFTSHVSILNGIIGTVPEHPLMRWCVEHVNDYASNFKKKQSTKETLQGTGIRFFKKAFLNVQADAPEIVLFPFTFFTPWPSHERHKQKNAEKWVQPESYALHMWHGAWRTGGRPPRPENA
jgi:mannosyltransferase OCH1-like enzyme